MMLSALLLIAAIYPDFGRTDAFDFSEIGPEEYRPLRRELLSFHPRECHDPPKDEAVTNSFARIFDKARK